MSRKSFEDIMRLLYMKSLLNDLLPQHTQQSIWREKQLNIFYRSGRPIFNIDEKTMHIRAHNNPYFFSDPLIVQRTPRPIKHGDDDDERKKNSYMITNKLSNKTN
jgi:hypothetical protein